MAGTMPSKVQDQSKYQTNQDEEILVKTNSTFLAHLKHFKQAVIVQVEQFLNSSANVTEASLEKLRSDWVLSAEQLTYNKDSSLEKHFLRPIQVNSWKRRNLKYCSENCKYITLSHYF